jgi:hypothetical protein
VGGGRLDASGSGLGPMAGCYEHGSIKGGEYLDHPSDC